MSLAQLLDDRARVVPLTVEQYHMMIETGILPEGEPIELIDGMLIRKDRSHSGENPMMVGHAHAWVIRRLTLLLRVVERHGFTCQIQLPITLSPGNEPEPDVAILRAASDNFRTRHPGPEDVACLIEVADSSLQYDRITKQRIYAHAGIPQYLIINLVDSIVEDYRSPQPGTGRYQPPHLITKDETVQISLSTEHAIEIPATEFLP